MTKRKAANQGMNWIRPVKRLAIYMRDGLACVYCGATVEDGAVLTLDHVKCYAHSGDHSHTNLVTACRRCNSSRGTRSIRAFALVVAAYLGKSATVAQAIQQRVKFACRQELPMDEAKRMMARRGSLQAVIRNT